MICKALPFAYKGGIQTHVWELSKALIGLGHEVTILTAGNRHKGNSLNGENCPKVLFLPFVPGRMAPGLEHFIQDVTFNIQVNRWVRKNHEDFDIIHLQGRSGFLLSCIKVKPPIICTVHRLFPIEVLWGNHHYSTILDKFLHGLFSSKYEDKIIEKCDKIIAVSNKTRSEMKNNNGLCAIKKVKVISNGAKTIANNLRTDFKKKQIIFVGRLSKVKGLCKLLNAMTHIDSSLNLIIVGSGPYEKNIKQRIKGLDLQNRVKLLGEQTNEKVYQLISESQALVLPSFHESQGIVLLEANAMNTPVIASNSSGMREIVSHGYNGLLFNPDDFMDLAAKVNMLVKSPRRSQLMGIAGQYIVEKKYSWDKIAKETSKLYKECA